MLKHQNGQCLPIAKKFPIASYGGRPVHEFLLHVIYVFDPVIHTLKLYYPIMTYIGQLMVGIETTSFEYKRKKIKEKNTFFLPPMHWLFICRNITLFIIHEMISSHLIMYITLLRSPMRIT